RLGNLGHNLEARIGPAASGAKKVMVPWAQTQISLAPASKYRAIFSWISASVLLGDKTSTQISGAREKQTLSATSWMHLGEAQATSAAFTPSAVEMGHSVKTRPRDIRLPNNRAISA